MRRLLVFDVIGDDVVDVGKGHANLVRVTRRNRVVALPPQHAPARRLPVTKQPLSLDFIIICRRPSSIRMAAAAANVLGVGGVGAFGEHAGGVLLPKPRSNLPIGSSNLRLPERPLILHILIQINFIVRIIKACRPQRSIRPVGSRVVVRVIDLVLLDGVDAGGTFALARSPRTILVILILVCIPHRLHLRHIIQILLLPASSIVSLLKIFLLLLLIIILLVSLVFKVVHGAAVFNKLLD